MGIRKEIGNEWGAFRSTVADAKEIYGSDLYKLPGLLRRPLSAVARLIAEFE